MKLRKFLTMGAICALTIGGALAAPDATAHAIWALAGETQSVNVP